MNHPSPISRSGFTLIEILVATTISVVLISIVIALSGNVLTNSREIMNRTVREADAHFALEVVIADLEALVLGGRTGGEVLSITPEQVAGVDSTWMLLLTNPIDQDSGVYQRAPRSVSYRMAHQNTIDGSLTPEATHALYRAVANAAQTFEHATGVDNLKADFWESSDVTPAPPQPTEVTHFLVGNVVGFEVRFLRADTKEWTRQDDTISIRTGETVVQSGTGGTPPVEVRGGLLAAEARITVLSPQGAKLLQINAMPLEDLVRQHGRTYSRQTGNLPELLRSSLL